MCISFTHYAVMVQQKSIGGVYRVVGVFAVVITLLMNFEISDAKRIHSFAGPYRVLGHITPNMTQDYKSENKITFKLWFTSPDIRKHQYVWGDSYNAVAIDDSLDIDILISSWSNNQWKPNAFVMKFKGACTSAMRHAKSILPYLFGEEGKSCPIQAGHRQIKNQSFYPVFPEFPVFPYGRWLFNIIIHKEKPVLGVLSIVGEAVPKL